MNGRIRFFHKRITEIRLIEPRQQKVRRRRKKFQPTFLHERDRRPRLRDFERDGERRPRESDRRDLLGLRVRERERRRRDRLRDLKNLKRKIYFS